MITINFIVVLVWNRLAGVRDAQTHSLSHLSSTLHVRTNIGPKRMQFVYWPVIIILISLLAERICYACRFGWDILWLSQCVCVLWWLHNAKANGLPTPWEWDGATSRLQYWISNLCNFFFFYYFSLHFIVADACTRWWEDRVLTGMCARSNHPTTKKKLWCDIYATVNANYAIVITNKVVPACWKPPANSIVR